MSIGISMSPLTSAAQGVPPAPPDEHDQSGNQPSGNGAPIGGGMTMLLSMGAAYGGKKYYDYRKKLNNEMVDWAEGILSVTGSSGYHHTLQHIYGVHFGVNKPGKNALTTYRHSGDIVLFINATYNCDKKIENNSPSAAAKSRSLDLRSAPIWNLVLLSLEFHNTPPKNKSTEKW